MYPIRDSYLILNNLKNLKFIKNCESSTVNETTDPFKRWVKTWKYISLRNNWMWQISMGDI